MKGIIHGLTFILEDDKLKDELEFQVDRISSKLETIIQQTNFKEEVK